MAKRKNKAHSDNILEKILSTLRSALFWAIFAAIATLIGVISTIHYNKTSAPKKSRISLTVGDIEIGHDQTYNIYTFIPEGYYEHNVNGAIIFSLYNAGESDLNNASVLIETDSITDNEYSFNLPFPSRLSSLNNINKRFDQRTEKEDVIAGDQIKIRGEGGRETVEGRFHNIPSGMAKRVQIEYHYDPRVADYYQNLLRQYDAVEGYGVLYDELSLRVSYGSSEIPMSTIENVGVQVWKTVEIPDLIKNWRENGALQELSIHNPIDFEQLFFKLILVYPKIITIDGVKHPSYVDANYYYVEYSNPLKSGLRRECRVTSLSTGYTEHYEQKDSKEHSDDLKHTFLVFKDNK